MAQDLGRRDPTSSSMNDNRLGLSSVQFVSDLHTRAGNQIDASFAGFTTIRAP
jgi:hypothetical protein